VMNRKIAWLRPDTPVEHAADFMRDAGIHRVLIMEDDRLLGLLSTTDIAGAVADNKLTKRVYVFDRTRSAGA
jgi:acetoin utilization protein AcuB